LWGLRLGETMRILLPILLSLSLHAGTIAQWTFADSANHGVLLAEAGELDGLEIVAEPSSFGAGLFAQKGSSELPGGTVLLHVERGKDFSGEPISAAVEKAQFAEFAIQVDGLQEGEYLELDSFTWKSRSNGSKHVSGALIYQVAVNGELSGKPREFAKTEMGDCSGPIARRIGNGRLVLRIYLAGFDAKSDSADGLQGFTNFHAGLQLGAVELQGRVGGRSYTFAEHVLPTLKSRCFKCHGPDKQKGDIRLDTLATDLANNAAAAETWHDAANLIMRGEMPPEDARELSDEQRGILLGWIEENLEHAIAGGLRFSEGVVMRRLNRAEYQFTMSDLLGFEMDYTRELPADALSPDGFRNNGAALGMSGLRLESYLASAREAMDFALVDGEQPERVAEVIKAKTMKMRGKRYVGAASDRLGRVNFWTGAFNEFPETGPFTIRITARAERKPGQPAPIVAARYGYFVTGLTINIMDDAGSIEIPSTESAVYEIRGRAEFMPAAEAQVPRDKINGIIALQNVLNDGQGAPKQEEVITESVNKKGKTVRKKSKKYIEDPDFPKVIIEKVELVRQDYPSWPPPVHRRLAPESASLSIVLSNFLRRAWRRPPSDAEVAEWMTHLEAIRAEGDSDVDLLRETFAAILASPGFLYLLEPAEEGDARPLSAHELATRLSYFLWSSLPDAELSARADSGELLKPEILRAEFARLLAHPRAARFAEQFATQWLDLDGVDRVAINPQYYGDFDNALKPYLAQESIAFFREILRSDSSALQFIDADFTMLNGPLARHYGLDGPASQQFERVSLQGTDRPGGLLAHASMHLSGSDGADSHPIRRAVWIRERLLHDPPKPPPPDVPDIEDSVPNFTKLSIREQLSVHRQKAACADCHRGIDPWGIALERFDAIGKLRDKTARGKKRVSTETVLPGGYPIDGLRDLQAHLLEYRRGQFAHALVSKLLTFGLGRSVELDDKPLIKRLAAEFAKDDYRLQGLMANIVSSEAFRTR
jgi:hypothetical protein